MSQTILSIMSFEEEKSADEWHLELGFTLIAVDHRPEILEKFCVRAAVIESGQIVQEGSWSSLAAAPATPLLAHLLARE